MDLVPLHPWMIIFVLRTNASHKTARAPASYSMTTIPIPTKSPIEDPVLDGTNATHVLSDASAGVHDRFDLADAISSIMYKMDEEVDDEAQKSSVLYSPQQLAEWDFYSKSKKKLTTPAGQEQRFIQVPKKNKFVLHLNEKYDIEHKGWFYYLSWWVLVSAPNVTMHAVLSLRANGGGKNLYTLASANLFTCIFSRTVWFKWLVYLPTIISKPMPMSMKMFFNKMVVNNGGVHTCTAAWLCLDWAWIIALSIVRGAGGSPREAAHFFIASVALAILFFIVLFAMPYRDNRVYHDLFEQSHRYGGWLLAGIFTIDVILSLSVGGDDTFALKDPALWFVIGSIFLTAYPWLGILKVYNAPAHIFIPSDWVAIVSWTPKPWFSVPGTAGQLAFESAGTKEYHPFALLNDINGNPRKATMAVAKAGDWTSKLIEDGKKTGKNDNFNDGFDVETAGATTYDDSEPNYKLCLSRVAAPGFMYLVRNYKRVLCIGTGAGIAPIASFLPNPPNDMMILWVGRKFNETYGPLTKLVTSHKHSILIDTKEEPSLTNPYNPGFRASIDNANGTMRITENLMDAERPVLPQLAMAAVELFKADAVFIVSGPTSTFQVCHELWKAGIHAYGATWDS